LKSLLNKDKLVPIPLLTIKYLMNSKKSNYSIKDSKEIETAIKFLITEIEKKCYNKKPLILHSIKTGMTLMKHSQPKEVVIAGLLHDLLEDTDCKAEDIKAQFGNKVAELVQANTFDPNIKDKKERFKEAVNRVKKAGKQAVMIKVADSLDNFPYYTEIFDKQKKQEILWKHQQRVKAFESAIGNTKLFKEYQAMVKQGIMEKKS